MPTLTAATDATSGSPGHRPLLRNQPMASANATYPAVIAAVRVPPSACNTSQSMTIVFSPSAFVSTQARSARPTSREISWVRPLGLPLIDSRSVREVVARGSIAYSAVTHPTPFPLRHLGTSSWTLAAHKTRVLPNSASTEPSAWSSQARVNNTGRSWSAARPSGRVMPATLAGVPGSLVQVEDLADRGKGDGTTEDAHGLAERCRRVVPRHQVGKHQVPGTGPF